MGHFHVTTLCAIFFMGDATAQVSAVANFKHHSSFLAYSTGDSVATIATHPLDQDLIATSSNNGEIALWDLSTFSAYWRLQTSEWATGLGFSSSGQLLAAGGNHKVLLLNLADGQIVRSLEPTASDGKSSFNWHTPEKAIFSRSDEDIFIGYTDVVFHFSVVTGQKVGLYGHPWGVKGSVSPVFFLGVLDLRLSSDEQFLFVLTKSAFYTFLVATQELVREFSLSNMGFDLNDVRRGVISESGKLVILAAGIEVMVIDGEYEKVIQRRMAAASNITSLSITNDLCCYALASWDGTSRMFEIATNRELGRVDDNRPSSERAIFMSVAPHGASDAILTGDASGFVTVWRAPSLEP